jgi:hypothetical protein
MPVVVLIHIFSFEVNYLCRSPAKNIFCKQVDFIGKRVKGTAGT